MPHITYCKLAQIGLLSFFMGCANPLKSTDVNQDKPNVILIMADDLGYECVAANGADDYKTPVLDRLASKGARFTNCFANPLCTPSRVKIMTGMYNVRNYKTFGKLDRSQKTFAHEFKKAGYTTCIAGKWQLGREQDSPQHFGFDQAMLWQHKLQRLKPKNDKVKGKHDSRYENPILEKNGQAIEYTNGEYGPDICGEFITDFIETNKDRPFMVYYPMILTHCPFVPAPGTPDYDPTSPGAGNYNGNPKYFGDMVHHMDIIVGRIVAKLEELELRENTLILFMGDNGTDKFVTTSMSGKEIKGNKGTMTDAGTRVPLIVSWPGHIEEGKVYDDLVELSDMFPTICEAAGIPTPTDRPIDGVSFLSTLKGEPGRDKPWVYIWYKGEVMARTKHEILVGDQKLSDLKFLYSPKAFEAQEVAAADMTIAQKKTRATLEKVIKDLAAERNSAIPKRSQNDLTH